MVPSSSQVPPSGFSAGHSVSTAPSAMETFLSVLAVKKPTSRPSGDQKGNDASSVRGSMRASADENGRSQRFVDPACEST